MSLFITFEGPEGCGKSTQARLLSERLQARGYDVVLTREPGGTRIGNMIRRILLDLQHTEMSPVAETLLFAAARAQLVDEVIRPILASGGIVICDRYIDSTFAYQGYGLGRDAEELRTITRIATGGLMPDLTILLDISIEEGLKRKHRMQQAALELAESPLSTGLPHVAPIDWNRFEARGLDYLERVLKGFYNLMAAEPQRWRRIDGHGALDEIAQQIDAAIEPVLSYAIASEQPQ